MEKAKNAVDEGTKMLTVRQKHIKLADRSEFGWKFVKEYETDDLAEDDQDEKRIAKAEKLALPQLRRRKYRGQVRQPLARGSMDRGSHTIQP